MRFIQDSRVRKTGMDKHNLWAFLILSSIENPLFLSLNLDQFYHAGHIPVAIKAAPPERPVFSSAKDRSGSGTA
jgi:hypothetical protein